jgi:hypothetical protein
MDIFAKRQIDIAKKTLKMSDAGAKIMGGMTKEEAREILKKYKIKFDEAKDLVGKYLTEELSDRDKEWIEIVKSVNGNYSKAEEKWFKLHPEEDTRIRQKEWEKYLKRASGNRQEAEKEWFKDHPLKRVSTSEISKYKDLGTSNGWNKRPVELVKCEKKLHTLGAQEIGRGYTEHYCPICKIRYSTDSSD